MRQRTSDVPMKLMRTPEHGALRSYSSARGGVFVLSRLSATKHSANGAWRLTHQPSGATALARSYADGVALIRRLQSPPGAHEGAEQRFVILPRALDGTVLFDRVTGQWFPRRSEQPVRAEEMEEMAALRPADGDEQARVLADWQMELLTSSTPTPSAARADERSGRATARRARRR